jgi:hypothetical protein
VRKDANRSFYRGLGLGLGFRVVGMEANFQPLDSDAVSRAYRAVRAAGMVMMIMIMIMVVVVVVEEGKGGGGGWRGIDGEIDDPDDRSLGLTGQARRRVLMMDYGGTLVAADERTENVEYYAVSHKLVGDRGACKL